jgi:DNA ligase-4
MLSKRPLRTLAEAVRKVGERNFIIEEKLDGERIQLHKRGAEYLYCSRQARLHISVQMTDIRM